MSLIALSSEYTPELAQQFILRNFFDFQTREDMLSELGMMYDDDAVTAAAKYLCGANYELAMRVSRGDLSRFRQLMNNVCHNGTMSLSKLLFIFEKYREARDMYQSVFLDVKIKNGNPTPQGGFPEKKTTGELLSNSKSLEVNLEEVAQTDCATNNQFESADEVTENQKSTVEKLVELFNSDDSLQSRIMDAVSLILLVDKNYRHISQLETVTTLLRGNTTDGDKELKEVYNLLHTLCQNTFWSHYREEKNTIYDFEKAVSDSHIFDIPSFKAERRELKDKLDSQI